MKSQNVKKKRKIRVGGGRGSRRKSNTTVEKKGIKTTLDKERP